MILISTHSLTKRLTTLFKKSLVILTISTHSLTKRLTRRTRNVNQKSGYFNSQPHEEADLSTSARSLSIVISTHSLTKRLTRRESGYQADSAISTHSLTKRLTPDWLTSFKLFFISTHSLTKRLTRECGYWECGRNISTHSLTKRLTDTPPQIERKICIFQLTASRRG